MGQAQMNVLVLKSFLIIFFAVLKGTLKHFYDCVCACSIKNACESQLSAR